MYLAEEILAFMFSLVTPSKMPNTTKDPTAKYTTLLIFQNELMQKLCFGTTALSSGERKR
jgi:hypothetical protein